MENRRISVNKHDDVSCISFSHFQCVPTWDNRKQVLGIISQEKKEQTFIEQKKNQSKERNHLGRILIQITESHYFGLVVGAGWGGGWRGLWWRWWFTDVQCGTTVPARRARYERPTRGAATEPATSPTRRCMARATAAQRHRPGIRPDRTKVWWQETRFKSVAKIQELKASEVFTRGFKFPHRGVTK